jgi:acyl carrier protein
MALKDPAVLRRFEQAGLGGMPAQTGIRLLNAVMDMVQYPSAAWIAGSIAWERLLSRGKRSEVPAMFGELRQLSAPAREQNKHDGPVVQLSVDARSPPAAKPVSLVVSGEMNADVRAVVQEVVNGLLGRSVAPDQPLMEAGLDSLGVVELRNQLQTKLGVDLPATLTFDHPSVAALTTFLAASTRQSLEPQRSPETHNTLRSLVEVRVQVDKIVQEVLGGAAVPPDQPLMAAGLDSLGAVELRNRLSEVFDGVDLPATLTFDHPTIEQLTSYIHSLLLGSSTALVPQNGVVPLLRSPANVLDSWSEGSELVAVSCRYPVHETSSKARLNSGQSPTLWQTLYASADLQRVVPLSRWDMDRLFSPTSGDGMRFYARFAAFCDGVELFDPSAFRLSVQEATALDPQIRLLLEEASVACGNATLLDAKNYGSDTFTHGLPVGVYSGCMYHEHMAIVTAGTATLAPQAIVGNGAPYMVGRLSYTFGFSGKLGFVSFFVCIALHKDCLVSSRAS